MWDENYKNISFYMIYFWQVNKTFQVKSKRRYLVWLFLNEKKSKNQIYIHSLSEVNRGLIFSSKNFNLLTNWKTWTGWAHNNSQTFSGSLGGCTSFSSSKTGWCFSKYLKDKSKQTMKPDFSITYSNLQWSQHYCEELQLIRVTFDLFQICE